MSKQVDVKALISHVIRGDGVNKCRICMGDTSEGQVHLGDIVLMEGDKPVTLSEVLEIVTGIPVLLDSDMPAGLCTECFNCAVKAANFRSMCRQTCSKWDMTLQLLCNLPSDAEKNKLMFSFINDNQMIVIIDDVALYSDTASERLAKHLTKQLYKNEEPEEETLKNESERIKEVQNESINGNKLDLVTTSERLGKHLTLARNKGCVKVAQCPNCNKMFQHPLKLYHHLKASTDMKRACHICCEIMPRNDLMPHLVKAHNIKVYDCKKCPALLLTRKAYNQHLAKAHSRGMCTCIECGQTFRTSQAFHAHISVHRQKTCPSCDKVFRNQTCYLYHVKNCCHLDSEDFKTKVRVEVRNEISKRNITVGLRGSTEKECICNYCGKKFAKKKYVAAHIQIVHMKTTHSPCVYCGKFLATAHMTEHIKKHELDLSFTCEHCGIVLKTKLGYIQHLRLHTGERPYACKICKETFSASSRRSEHMRKVHKGPDELKHACRHCPAKFRLPYKLRKHMNSSHINDSGETPQFVCNKCHEKFGSSRGLLHHSRKHQNVPFPHKKPEKSIVLKVFSEPYCDEEK